MCSFSHLTVPPPPVASATDSHKITVVAGRNPVRELLQRGDAAIEKVLIQRSLAGGALGALRSLAEKQGAPVQMVPPQTLDRHAPKANHQGVIALIAPVAYAELHPMLSDIAPDREGVRAECPVVVALDRITDPYNFGAILRSAVAAGAGGVIVPERHMAPLSAVTVKASAGAALRIPVARVANLSEALIQCKERGYWVIGLDAASPREDESGTVWTCNWERPIVLVIGSEGEGLRSRVRSECDEVVSIPMRGEVESLNASVAAGVALFAAVRNRRAEPSTRSTQNDAATV